MGLIGFTQEVSSPISAKRMFNAAVLDGHNLGPKLLPGVVVSGVIVEGDGGVGSIKHYRFTEVIPFPYVKERVDILDKENLEYKYTMIEGGDIGTKLQYCNSHVKFEDDGNGGCVRKQTCEYMSLDGVKYTAEEMHVSKEAMMGMYKTIEAYLIANPDAYA